MAGQIDVSCIIKSHYLVPFQALGEHVEGLGLLHERRKLLRMMTVRDSQKKTSAVGCQAPDFQISRACYQSIIIIVRRILNR